MSYIPLASFTVSSPTTQIDFTNIDQAYGDLVLQIQAKTDTNEGYLKIYFNDDKGQSYANVMMTGSESNGFAESDDFHDNFLGEDFRTRFSDDAGTSYAEIDIRDYSNTNKTKVGLVKVFKATPPGFFDPNVIYNLAEYVNNNAITSIQIELTSSSAGSAVNISNNSVFTLYGIEK